MFTWEKVPLFQRLVNRIVLCLINDRDRLAFPLVVQSSVTNKSFFLFSSAGSNQQSPLFVLRSMTVPSGHYFLSQYYYHFTKLMLIFQSSPIYLRLPSLPYQQTSSGWTSLFSCHSIGTNTYT